MQRIVLLLLVCLLAAPAGAQGRKAKEEESPKDDRPVLDAGLVAGLKLRNIGPAFMSGRIGEIAVDPVKPATWYVAVASGGMWKTENAGTTWEPIFDGYGSYSIGTVALDPNDRHTVWVGTGENNSQRSVGYGDGVYKSVDGGKSFVKVGLDSSEHVARILVDSRDSDVVLVAAQGPLWSAGGHRGVYKTTDGGETWKHVLDISEHTGATDLVADPRDPDVLYAAAYQRRRHVWTLINGGPESGVWKSTDGGETWRAIDKGLPSGDKGRIGLAISPIEPDVLYAIVEAAGDAGGFFRSTDAGATWAKMSDYVAGSPQYYNEIYADPHRFGRVYSMDTYSMVSDDHGATFRRLGGADKHVDDHALWLDPADPDHFLIGSDGGLYQTWDGGTTYQFFSNLPITQFYKVAVSNDRPFYYVYGGTQDNATQGGPSRTTNVHGIRNSDWFVTVFGDGFDPAVDPENPDIVYSQWQYGGLVRYDRKTGETVDIKPQEAAGGPPLRWNWDSPLAISPHRPSRLYYAAQMVFRSDDRGDTWEPVSPDLTRQLDRNRLPVMGRVWSVDAVAKNASTSFYGNVVALAESPLVAGLLYAGTDDGLVQVSEDGGATWRRADAFTGVPEMTYVNDIEPSLHDPNTVYAAFNNHKRGDFKPYVLRSTDRGRTWTSVAGDLPARGSVYTLALDHERPDLLFAGTEFGVFFTVDGGAKWIQLKGGMPTIAVRELEVQRRENDLVVASFGRGFFILDDYTPLRHLSDDAVQQAAVLFPVRPAPWYVQDAPLALEGKSMQGASFFVAPNPPYGATFTYYLKESLTTRKARRQEAEAEQAKAAEDVFYPSWDSLRAEDREEAPAVTLTVRDEDGNVVRRVAGATSKGLHRATWDFRYPGYAPLGTSGDGYGPLAVPGTYTVSLEQRVDGVTTQLAAPVPFAVEAIHTPSLPVGDREAALAFQKEVGRLQRAVMGAARVAADALDRLAHVKHAIAVTPALDPALREQALALESRLLDLQARLSGDPTRPRRNEPEMPGIADRVGTVVYNGWSTTAAPTTTHRRNYDVAAAAFEEALGALRQLVEGDLPALEAQLDAAGAPWTPGRRIPDWNR